MTQISKDLDVIGKDLVKTGKDTCTLCSDVCDVCIDTVTEWYDKCYKFCTTLSKGE